MAIATYDQADVAYDSSDWTYDGEYIGAPPATAQTGYGGGMFLGITHPHQVKPPATIKKRIVGHGSLACSVRIDGLGQAERPAPPRPVRHERTVVRPPVSIPLSRPMAVAAVIPVVAAIEPVVPVRNRRREEEEFLAMILAGVL